MNININELSTLQIEAFNACGFIPVKGAYKITQKDCPLNISLENNKLVPSDFTRFIIWNLPAIKTCPGATKDCIKFCYAKRTENFRKEAKEARARHYKESLRDDFTNKMIVTITYWINTPNFKKAKNISVRIHESGDFYSLEYIQKWFNVMIAFKHVSNLNFIAYTKSFPLFRIAGTRPENFILTGSLDNSSTGKARLDCDMLGIQKYIAVPATDIAVLKPNKEFLFQEAITNYHHECKCADCGHCRYCYTNHPGKTTVCAIH